MPVLPRVTVSEAENFWLSAGIANAREIIFELRQTAATPRAVVERNSRRFMGKLLAHRAEPRLRRHEQSRPTKYTPAPPNRAPRTVTLRKTILMDRLPLQLNPVEVRVLGSLTEKDITTPDYYPLSLNALVNACNQKNNRDPVMSVDEDAVRQALGSLQEKRLAGQPAARIAA